MRYAGYGGFLSMSRKTSRCYPVEKHAVLAGSGDVVVSGASGGVGSVAVAR
jgi:NADPH:quinone reductase-like Zn-dependent oxidoreductase